MNLSLAISEGRQVAPKTVGGTVSWRRGPCPHVEGQQLAGKDSSDL